MEIEGESDNKVEKEEKVYIGLGTGYVFMRGEDRLGRGRISFLLYVYIYIYNFFNFCNLYYYHLRMIKILKIVNIV